MDVGQHTTGGYGDTTQQLVELLIIADCQLDVVGDDAVLLVVAGGVAGKLDNLGQNVLQDSSKVDWAPAQMLEAYLPFFRYRWTRPTGN